MRDFVKQLIEIHTRASQADGPNAFYLISGATSQVIDQMNQLGIQIQSEGDPNNTWVTKTDQSQEIMNILNRYAMPLGYRFEVKIDKFDTAGTRAYLCKMTANDKLKTIGDLGSALDL